VAKYNGVSEMYKIIRTKETATGKRYLVRDNFTGKLAIATYVSSDGNAMSPENQGKYGYIMPIWNKISGKSTVYSWISR
jgi:hypothetical protein